MAYQSLNDHEKMRKPAHRPHGRYTIARGLVGQVIMITDHERQVFYDQRRFIAIQQDLFSETEPLLFMCDYCGQVVPEVRAVTVETLNTFKAPVKLQIKISCCPACDPQEIPFQLGPFCHDPYVIFST